MDLDEVRTKLYSAVLSDILDQVGCTGQVAAGLHPLVDAMRVVGYARTARAVAVNRVPERPYEHLMAVIDTMGTSDVLVIATERVSTSAIFGGLLATAVTAAGGVGVITDGYSRDAQEIRRIGLATVTRGLVPLDSLGRDEVVEYDTLVSLAGVPVATGDLVFADIDGVVVVPQALTDKVVTMALAKVAGENDVRTALRSGMSTSEAFAKYGIL